MCTAYTTQAAFGFGSLALLEAVVASIARERPHSADLAFRLGENIVRIGIIGAGMAGLSCGIALAGAGHDVKMFDKGRGPGGRMSTRRIATPMGEVTFDHGAQYLTARDPDFVRQVAEWAAEGHVERWLVAGADAWVGTPAMNAPIRALAAKLPVRWGARVDAIMRRDDGWTMVGEGVDPVSFDAAIIAVPAEQVPSLVTAHRPDWADAAQAVRSDPCWTVMAAYAVRLPIEPDRLTDRGILASAVRNSVKPGRDAKEAWVLQASGAWSADHLEDAADTVEAALLAALSAAAGRSLPAPIATSVHRWRYAKSGALGVEPLWDRAGGLGICGDWLIGGRIEAAWLAGQRLAQAIGRVD